MSNSNADSHEGSDSPATHPAGRTACPAALISIAKATAPFVVPVARLIWGLVQLVVEIRKY